MTDEELALLDEDDQAALGAMTPPQRELARYMSELSEDAYCAYWLMGLEHVLWQVRRGTRATGLNLEFTDEHRERLRALSNACGGWIVWREVGPHGGGEAWVSFDEWRPICEAHDRKEPSHG